MRSPFAWFLLVLPVSWSYAADDARPTFEKDVRPIFRAHCFDCHGATDHREGGLDLRLVRFMQRGGESGPALVTGSPEQSYLLHRIQNGEMPPGGTKVTPAELKVIEQWIAAGAPTARPEPETLDAGLGITPEERSFWSFQPIRRPAVSDPGTFSSEARVRTPIDALILQSRRESTGTDNVSPAFAPDADRRTLVMRTALLVTGLPPSPEDVKRWSGDNGEDWFDRLLTEHLDSPHYGEYWGRHWLDVAGYADSEGYTVADADRPWAWRYRDWVIQAMNADMPMDRFITEQLAGDELAGPIQGDLTPEQIDLLTATGFLRMAADGTGSGADNPDGRNQVMADTLKIIGTSLLGLSLQCAQCHDHRYDPIPQTDYFAIRAVFEPALDWQAWKTPPQRLISLYTAADRQRAAEVEQEAQQIAAERNTKQTEYMQQALDKELMKYEEPLRTQLRDAKQTAENERTEEQKQLLASHPSVNISPGVLYQYLPEAAEDLKKYDQRIAEVRGKKPPEQFIRALQEPANHVPVTKLFYRGDHQQPKQQVLPAGLSVTSPEGSRAVFPEDDPALPTTGRRLAFARWLTSRENPLFARVIVNRVWMHHFGKGLVATPADFGKLGAAPSDPELLDWLADEFIAQGWSLKKLHRLIMTSTVWRQTKESAAPEIADQSAPAEPAASVFPVPLIRLEAEAIRDRMLAVTGRLDRTLFGQPIGIQEDDTGQVLVAGEQTRRSMYIRMQRSRPVAMLQAFDAPVMETNCECRSSSTVATQSLMLLNGEFILDQAARLAERVAAESTPLLPEQIAMLPAIPKTASSHWSYGFGAWDEQLGRTASFTPLGHWNGTRWQAGSELPDPQSGWVLLHAHGGHPDLPERGVVRRWTATANGTLSVAGTLSHGSPHGDGVRGRIISSRLGKLGEWIAFNGSSPTPVSEFAVTAGDTIDFLTDCLTNQTSDSFEWPVTLTLTPADGPAISVSSVAQFRGPTDSPETILGRIVRAWELAYCREPSRDELLLAAGFVAGQVELLQANPAAVPTGRSEFQQALINLCQVLMSSNEFLYVE